MLGFLHGICSVKKFAEQSNANCLHKNGFHTMPCTKATKAMKAMKSKKSMKDIKRSMKTTKPMKSAMKKKKTTNTLTWGKVPDDDFASDVSGNDDLKCACCEILTQDVSQCQLYDKHTCCECAADGWWCCKGIKKLVQSETA